MPTTHKRRIGDTYDSGVSSNRDATIGTYCTIATDNLLTDTTDLILSVLDVNGDAVTSATYVRLEVIKPTGQVDNNITLATNGSATITFGTAAHGQFMVLSNASGVASIQMLNLGTNGIVHHTFVYPAVAVGTALGGSAPGYLAITL